MIIAIGTSNFDINSFISQLVVILPVVSLIVGFASAYLRAFIQKEIGIAKNDIITGIKAEFAQSNLVKSQLENIAQQVSDSKERLKRLENSEDKKL